MSAEAFGGQTLLKALRPAPHSPKLDAAIHKIMAPARRLMQHETCRHHPDGSLTVEVLGAPFDPALPRAALPRVVRGPRYPMTVYAPSLAHDSWLVVYGIHWPSASRWVVPGTVEERE